MATKRSYQDACGIAHGLDLVGERWALLVVRELLLGPKRYGQLRADLPGIGTNVLAQRLSELEASRLLRKRRLPPPTSATVYELTEWAYELEPVLRALGRWAVRSPDHDAAAYLSATSFLLSLRTNFDPARAEGVRARVELRVGAEVARAVLEDGKLLVERGPQEAPDAVLTGPPEILAGVVYGGHDLGATVAAGHIQAEGDLAAAGRILGAFSLPTPVDPAVRTAYPVPSRARSWIDAEPGSVPK
ncbi:winged helix-turn-helix transcriptional regulator [Streptomyces durmitorensis]|uniref:Winged helix-turn-helix transcriptional regulator n=1 Tax=Streptomyces durmitorensis TaxID=319947 RepID=A0ABY4Q647_9ACTN|nr:winged helix-turn-helix transcriptional regulator [Streptomyces durmitorensis]UQT61196.1 winged helix-turn-helix transcriptional regulator [Streptomyces durmitorensis]